MSDMFVTEEEITEWLKQEYAVEFSGWDFSCIENRRLPLGQLSWDYVSVVKMYLSEAESVLDIDTGGGERLARMVSSSSFSGRVVAVEGYRPNVPIARARLRDSGVVVHDISAGKPALEEGSFDLVIDRHGGSYSPAEIYRLLRPGGRYITEQVGDRTNRELRSYFRCPVGEREAHNLATARAALGRARFVIAQGEEAEYPVRFMDAGALVYYLKAVPWEVPEFSIERHAERLVALHRGVTERGFAIEATYHAYLVIAARPRSA